MRLTTHEARRLVVDHLEDSGMVVYEQRVRHGLPAMGQVVMVDPRTGRSSLVRVMTGKRPPRSKRLLIDRRRVGLCDLIAVVDPRDGSVHLEAPEGHDTPIPRRPVKLWGRSLLAGASAAEAGSAE